MGATLTAFGGGAGVATAATEGGTSDAALYLFGGMTEGYKCDDSGATDTTNEGNVESGIEVNQCVREPGVSNELWKLDASTGVWTNLMENDSSVGISGARPKGREGHTASRMGDGTILVFGGKTLAANDASGSGKNVLLGDMWELATGQTREEAVTYTSPALPHSLREGNMEYFGLNATMAEKMLGSSSSELEGELCIEDISVEVTITHSCSKSLQIGLFGPGPYTGGANFSPENRGSRAAIFGLAGAHSAKGCGGSANLQGAVFDDEGREGGDWSDYSETPWTGSHRSLDGLKEKFAGMKVNGEWTLEVYDSDVDGIGGTLDGFKIHFKVRAWHFSRQALTGRLLLYFKLTLHLLCIACSCVVATQVKPCESKFVWTEISSRACKQSYVSGQAGSSVVYDGCGGGNVNAIAGGSASSSAGPSPRFRHGSLVLGNTLYVSGGDGGSRLGDIWRYDKTSDNWVELNAVVETPMWSGRSLSLTPYGLMGFGGKNRDAEWNMEGRVWHYSVGNGVWNILGETEQSQGGIQRTEALEWRATGLTKDDPYPQVMEDAPQPHALSAIAGLGWERSAKGEEDGSSGRVLFGSAAEPMVALFGGNAGIARNKYNNDLRILRLRNLAAPENDANYLQEWEEFCGFRMEKGGTADLYFDSTCGKNGAVGSANPCKIRDLLERAYCAKEWQEIQNIY